MSKEADCRCADAEVWTRREHLPSPLPPCPGHNELDEPSFTSPVMYRAVRARPTFPAAYAQGLVDAGDLTAAQLRALVERLQAHLEAEFQAAAAFTGASGSTGLGSGAAGTHVVADGTAFGGKWGGMRQALPAELLASPPTGVDVAELQRIGAASVAAPPSFRVHDRLVRFHIQARLASLAAGHGVDWATAEALAFGSLIAEGHDVRMSGQDAQRGTFSHRHAVLVDQARRWLPVCWGAGADGRRAPCSPPVAGGRLDAHATQPRRSRAVRGGARCEAPHCVVAAVGVCRLRV